MELTVGKSFLSGEITLPVSKSFAHRAFICAFLSPSPTKILGKVDSADISATIACLRALGAKIDEIKEGFILYPPKTKANKAVLNCNESGSTLRFLLPVVSALNIEAEFIGRGQLPNRPLNDLISTLNNNGADINYSMPYITKGTLLAGEYKIKGNVSSQFISGLLMALPLLKNDSKIIITESLASRDYINITIAVLKSFGIKIEESDYGYFIKGSQKYITSGEYFVEGDWSSASVWVSAGLISGNITLLNMKYPSLQGDSRIIDLAKRHGANITINNDKITIKKSTLSPFDFSCDENIDLVPVLSTVCANVIGDNKLYDLERLRIKESDRLSAVIEMLTKIGIKNTYDKATTALTITGGQIIGGVKLNGHNDHRIVMASILCALTSSLPITVSDCEAVKKSYGSFFEDYKNLGGMIINGK